MKQEKSEGERMREIGAALGWTDIHGGPEDGGAYWRGTPPGSKRVIACPDWLNDHGSQELPTGKIKRRICNMENRIRKQGETIHNLQGRIKNKEKEIERLKSIIRKEAEIAELIEELREPTNQPSAMGGEDNL